MSAAELVPCFRDLYSRLPEMYFRQPWELQPALFLLGYTDDLADEAEIAHGRRGGSGRLAAMEGSMTNHRDERDDERERTQEAERRELEAAGWEPRGEGAKTIWRSPVDGQWYAHYQAVAAQRKARWET